jgi:SnoaL-like domain
VSQADMLWDIEQIKRLKARFLRYVDTKNDEGYLSLYAENLQLTLMDEEGRIVKEVKGKTELREWLAGLSSSRMTVHACYMPEIEIHDHETASSIWAMTDYVVVPGIFNFRGYGHYHEKYIKDGDGQWRICEVLITRLRVDHVLKAEVGKIF